MEQENNSTNTKKNDTSLLPKELIVKINRVILFIFVIGSIVGGIFYYRHYQKIQSQYEIIHLFFADKKFTKLIREDRKVKMRDIEADESMVSQGRYLIDKFKITAKLLKNGPLTNDTSALISNATKIKNVWYINNNLYINFSKEFLKNLDPKIKNDKMIIYSIVGSYFLTFPDFINSIYIYVENEPLKAISGKNYLNMPYKKDDFKQIISTQKSLDTGEELVHSFVIPNNN